MRILWITNIIFPEAAESLTGKGEIRSTGGWLVSMLDSLKTVPGIVLFTATVSSKVSELVEVKKSGVTHYIFPAAKRNYTYEKKYESFWRKVIETVNPDIIHIHGTECPHGLSCLNIFPQKTYVVSVQGLVTEIAKHFYDGLSKRTILSNITIRDILKTNLLQEQRRFYKRGLYEEAILKRVYYVIGRTSWDYAIVKSINPDLHYFTGNESLRNAFYTGRWEYNRCKPHTVFLSQVGVSYKGFHMFLKAMTIVLNCFPDMKVVIAGDNVLRDDGSWLRKKTISGYGKICNKIIEENHLRSKIEFTGKLNDEEMKAQLLGSNVFVSCSSIENSPNSLAEAQILGVPCVASYVGGVPDMIPNNDCGWMYRYEDYQKLAFLLIDIFNTSKYFDNSIMIKTAKERHNRDANLKSLLEVYNTIAKH